MAFKVTECLFAVITIIINVFCNLAFKLNFHFNKRFLIENSTLLDKVRKTEINFHSFLKHLSVLIFEPLSFGAIGGRATNSATPSPLKLVLTSLVIEIK